MTGDVYTQHVLDMPYVDEILGGAKNYDIPAPWNAIDALIYLVKLGSGRIKTVVVPIEGSSHKNIHGLYFMEREIYDEA